MRKPPTAKQLGYLKKTADYNDARVAEAERSKTAKIINLIRKKKNDKR